MADTAIAFDIAPRHTWISGGGESPWAGKVLVLALHPLGRFQVCERIPLVEETITILVQGGESSAPYPALEYESAQSISDQTAR
jgi:hypothetical protein